MKRRNFAAVQLLRVADALLSFDATARGQCLRGPDFAICPTADVMYVNDNGDSTLTALSLSGGVVKWHILLPKSDSDFDGPVATLDTVGVWSGIPNTRVDGFDAATGKQLWTIETSADDMAALGRYIFANDAEHWEGLTALDERTGKRVWHHSGTRLSQANRVRFYASDGRTLLTNLFAIDTHSGLILARWPLRREVSAGVLGDKFAVIGTALGRGTKLHETGRLIRCPAMRCSGSTTSYPRKR